jgi:hypothetical protein
MACADDAKASAKATANNLIIVTLLPDGDSFDTIGRGDFKDLV